MQFPNIPKPLVVIILDGWGISLQKEGNAITTADTPMMDMYAREYPTTALSASGVEVGLPWGEVGNSETGHRNIGAGQVMYQVLPKIDKAIQDRSFFTNQTLLGAIAHAKKNNSKLHIMGMLSDGGVHSHIRHAIALLELCQKEQFQEHVYLHIFTDGRDTGKQRAPIFLHQMAEAMKKFGVGSIATIMGRFYAMDRNENWDRTEQAYNTLTGIHHINSAPSAENALARAYKQEEFDENIPPTILTRGGEAVANISDNDAIIFFNFRPDRARQLTQAFVSPETVGFPAKKLQNIYFAQMAPYGDDITCPYAFAEDTVSNPLAKVLSDSKLTQLHIAETEKYAHVTYYLNVGNEQPYQGEEHVLIKSSVVINFADEPKMQAQAITDAVVDAITKQKYDVYFVNFANADMVGHTGSFASAVQACEFVDQCIARIHERVFAQGGVLVITADHGNAEEMINPTTHAIETDHTTNPVVFHVVAEHLRRSHKKTGQEIESILSNPIGVLTDVAPTILDILGIEKPSSMTGTSLLPSLR